MDKLPDPATDWLADAPLDPEQRHIWDHMRAELVAAREKIRDLEARVRLLERQPPDEEKQSILTRPEFNREVARMLAFDERYGGTSSVLYFDFEGLEKIAAQHGKAVANAAVREISDQLMKCVRGSDIVGRLAVDEFGVLLVRCDSSHAWKKGEQLSAQLYEALAEVHGCKLGVAISYGAYTFRENEDVGRGLKEAAQVLTKAKGGL
ncbi:MAG TPA: diguanylate cyclase [Alphaproteobacteria bacterium]|nr:diguanylate cyclase [Alphaproteobacteria bacterium]